MSFLRRFSWKTRRSEHAALLERIAALEAALSRRPAGLNPKLALAVAATMLGIGFAIGVYNDVILRVAANLLPGVEHSDLPRELKAGKAAYDRGEYTKALGLVQPLAEKGDARAQDLMGEIFYHRRDLGPDDAEAMKWFRAAAKQGSAAAQMHLGEMYDVGRAVPQNHAEAASWYRLAADQGYASAQYNLGLKYVKGEGVPQNNVLAHRWFNLAATRFPAAEVQNRREAVRNRDLVAKNMTPAELAEAHELARTWKPK